MKTKKAKKPNQLKKPSHKKLKKDAWDWFSKYIRLRDCLKTTGTKEWGTCITCNTRHHFKELQAGHFVSGRGNSVLFQEDGVHAQCMQCNFFKGGNPVAYMIKMIEMYGLPRTEAMQAEKRIIRSYRNEDLIEIACRYELAYKKLLGGI